MTNQTQSLCTVFLACLMFSGCQSSNIESTLKETPSQTPMAIKLTTPTFEYTSTVVTTVENPNFVKQCIPLIDKLPDDYIISGVLVVQNDQGDPPTAEVYLMDFDDKSVTLVNQINERIFPGYTSRDGRWIAYERYFKAEDGGKDSENEFVIVELNSSQRSVVTNKILKIEKGWSLIQWQDNDRLLVHISDPANENWVTSTVMIWNPFTGEKQIIRPDFPDMYELSPLSWGYGAVVYNPQGTRAIYLDNDYLYILWDIQKSESIATFELIGYYDIPPRWSPDGESLALVDNRGEISVISADGQIRRLTHLDDLYDFPDRNIYNLNWSPEGSKIAISLWTKDHDSDTASGDHIATLAIVDTATEKVVDTCLPISNEYGMRNLEMFWSPNGKQLIVKDESVDDYNRLILVDLERKIAAQVAEDMEPFGWMIPQE